MSLNYIQHDFVVPPEMNGAVTTHPVVVAGGGPVGMACALGLARRGVPVVVLEADRQVTHGSRAICISRRSLEILDEMGAAEAIADDGLWWTGGTSYYRDRPVFRLRMPHSNAQKFPPMLNIQQFRLEQYMLDQIERQPLIDYRWQTAISDIDAGDDGCALTLDTPEGQYALQARYVIAADGGRSATRRALGLSLNGTSYEGRYLIADIQVQNPPDMLVERKVWFDPPSNPGSTVILHLQPDGLWRLDFQLLPGQVPEEEEQPERVAERVRSHLEFIGLEVDWALDWVAVYKANAILLDDYRHKNVFFAGDAAHMVPIFGVRGLNSGYEDAQNLAWKLAAVIREQADERLLDSYSPERRAATLETIENATKSTWFMSPPTPGYQLAATAALSLAVDHDFARPLINPRQSAPIPYQHTALNLTSEREADFDGGFVLGQNIADELVEVEGQPMHLLDALRGEGELLALYFADGENLPEAELSELTEAAGVELRVLSRRVLDWPGGAPLLDRAGAVFEAFDARHGTIYLVRPDGHVCARWRQCSAETVKGAVAQLMAGGIAGGAQ